MPDTRASRKHDNKAVRKRAFYALMAGLSAALVFCGAFLWGMQANVRADQEASNATAATTNAQTLAQQVQQACTANGQLVVDERNLCAKAEKIAQEPAQPVPGPPGPKGDTGTAGKDSTVPGPAGQDGEDGADSLVAGPAGAAGTNGLDSQVPGPAGKDSTVPGPAGAAGATGADGTPGADGRGIASVVCEGAGDASYWLVTYDDGTTQTSGGPCRIQAAATAPAPTESP